MRFRPCIDLHGGVVKQIVGASLSDRDPGSLIVNFESRQSPAYYARLYHRDNLPGGHVIMLGPGNEEAAVSALAAYPGGLQVGGGITPENAAYFLEAGASHCIVTSYIFFGGRLDFDRLAHLVRAIGRQRLVIDLSCRRQEDGLYYVVTNRWQVYTEVTIDPATLERLAVYCDEFLIHAADVEGRRQGVDGDLVELLGKISPLPVTYAGGVAKVSDLDLVRSLGGGRVDLTIGSALDLFGGTIPYKEVVRWQREEEKRLSQSNKDFLRSTPQP